MFLRAVFVKQQCREQADIEDMEIVLIDNSEDGSDGKRGDRFCADGRVTACPHSHKPQANYKSHTNTSE